MHARVAQSQNMQRSRVVCVIVEHKMSRRLDQTNIGHQVGHQADHFELVDHLKQAPLALNIITGTLDGNLERLTTVTVIDH